MISRLSGKVSFKGTNKIEIEVNGVGYEVFISAGNLDKLKIDQEAEIFVYHHIAEDKNDLYGFLNRQDRLVFEMLIGVSGVGPKTAQNIFGIGNGEKILGAISKADVNFFKQVKGLGGKGAQRIIIDLKNKAGAVVDLDFDREGVDENIYQVLLNLGFTKNEARRALVKIPVELKAEDEKIKFALKELGKNK